MQNLFDLYRLSKLKILELRENHLKTLPKSFSRLTELERLDVGHNEFTELVSDIKRLTKYFSLSWHSVLLVKKTRVPGENHQPAANY